MARLDYETTARVMLWSALFSTAIAALLRLAEKS